MGLLEWIGEAFNPGPVGEIEVGKGDEDGGERHESFVWIRFVIALLLIGAVEYWIFSDRPLDWQDILRGNLVLLGYLLFAYFIRPRPNTENLGWGFLMINNPFRVSDNINRSLMLLGVLLLPGRFVVSSILALRRMKE